MCSVNGKFWPICTSTPQEKESGNASGDSRLRTRLRVVHRPEQIWSTPKQGRFAKGRLLIVAKQQATKILIVKNVCSEPHRHKQAHIHTQGDAG